MLKICKRKLATVEVLTFPEAAEFYDRDPRTIRGWYRSGILFGSVFKLGSQTYRISVRSLFQNEPLFGQDASWHSGNDARKKEWFKVPDLQDILKVGEKKARALIREKKVAGAVAKEHCFQVHSETFFKWLDSGQKSLSHNSDD